MKILNAQELIRLLANPSEIDNFSDENYCANQNVILDDTNGINLCCQQNLTLSSISFLKTFIYKAFPKNIEKYLKLYRLAFCNNNCSRFNFISKKPKINEIDCAICHKCTSSCLTCYNHYIKTKECILTDEEIDNLLTFYYEISQYLKGENFKNYKNSDDIEFTIGGGGDLFFSENYKKILKKDLTQFGFEKLNILTNLQTFNEKNLSEVNPKNLTNIKNVVFSFDGVTKEEYEYIRNGSNFDVAIKNFHNIKKFCPNAKIECSSVISKLNFQNLEKFPNFIYNTFPETNLLHLFSMNVWLKDIEMYALDKKQEEELENFKKINKNFKEMLIR